MRAALTAILLAALCPATAAAAPSVHGLTEDGRLIRFDAETPDLLQAAVPAGGLPQGSRLTGLDLNRGDGRLIAVEETATQRFLRAVDRTSGASARIAEAPAGDDVGGGLGADVTGDRLRMATDAQRLLTTGLDGAGSATEVAYAPGDAREGVAPQIAALATAPDGTLYGIDADADVLVRLTVTADGAQARSVARLSVDLDGRTALDIARDGTALLATTEEERARLYRLELATGVLRPLGAAGDGTPLLSIAIADAPAAAPTTEGGRLDTRPGAGGPPDTSSPALRLTRAHFDGRRLRVTLVSSEPCGGRLDVFQGLRRIGGARVARRAGVTRRRVGIRIGPRARRGILRTRILTVSVRMRDRAGNQTRLLVRIRFLRA